MNLSSSARKTLTGILVAVSAGSFMYSALAKPSFSALRNYRNIALYVKNYEGPHQREILAYLHQVQVYTIIPGHILGKPMEFSKFKQTLAEKNPVVNMPAEDYTSILEQRAKASLYDVKVESRSKKRVTATGLIAAGLIPFFQFYKRNKKKE